MFYIHSCITFIITIIIIIIVIVIHRKIIHSSIQANL